MAEKGFSAADSNDRIHGAALSGVWVYPYLQMGESLVDYT
jgi:hypothetical protein